MAFWGHSFMFNGIPCEDYDLMLYDIGSSTQSSGQFASGVTVVEDKLSTKWKPYFYGAKTEGKLEFSMVFGANQKRIDRNKYLDRYELDAIASWLTSYDNYMWLDVEQEDLEYIRYRCIITELDIVEFGNIPWALKAKVVCDSPYAYLHPQTFEYAINGERTISFYNESSHNGYYMPKIEFSGYEIIISEELTTIGERGKWFQYSPTISVNNEKVVLADAVATSYWGSRKEEENYVLYNDEVYYCPTTNNTGALSDVYAGYKVTMTANSINSLSIVNVSDANRTFNLGVDEPLPTSVKNIYADSDTGILTCDEGINIYPYTNFKFVKFVKGENVLKITGNGMLKIHCEFPVNVGG